MGAALAFYFAAMAAVSERAPRRPHVDFASIPPSQWGIHDRLLNWSRWARGRDNQSGCAGSPMFNLYRSSEARRAYGEETSVPVDVQDAMKLAKSVGHLPQQKRKAIHWYYLRGKNPAGAAREIGVELEQLAQLVRDGRLMLTGWV